MLVKTITYKDFLGNERTEDFYFNLTEEEAIGLELGTTGGLSEKIKRLYAAQDMPALISIFKDLIHVSYGVRSADGRKFVKNAEILEDFKATQAYSDLFMELATDDKKASEFFNSIIPKPAENQKTTPATIAANK